MPGGRVGSHCRIKLVSAQPSHRPSVGGWQWWHNERCHLLKTICRGPPPRFDTLYTSLDIISKAPGHFLRLCDVSTQQTSCLTPEGCATHQFVKTWASCSIFITSGLIFFLISFVSFSCISFYVIVQIRVVVKGQLPQSLLEKNQHFIIDPFHLQFEIWRPNSVIQPGPSELFFIFILFFFIHTFPFLLFPLFLSPVRCQTIQGRISGHLKTSTLNNLFCTIRPL